MAQLTPIFRRASWTVFTGFAFYAFALLILTNPRLQRHVIYAHKVNTAWWKDSNRPEQWGFAKSQVTPFNFTTPDNETLYAWHVLPLGLYAKHEAELLREPPGCAEDMAKTKAFNLLTRDPHARLIINFHGNAGSVIQGWRPDLYRSLSGGTTSAIHILAVDYRGFGRSTGFPDEQGLIIDGIATVKWALETAKIPPERIVIIGHSLGTQVTSAVVETFAKNGIEFAGVILISGFTDMATLLTSYAVGGWFPLLAPLRQHSALQSWYTGFLVDKWRSGERLANFVRASKRLRLTIIHAKDDYEIPYHNSKALFTVAANATTSTGMDPNLLNKMKARGTVHMDNGAFISTWKAGDNKVIREQIVAHGGHNRVTTFAHVALAALEAFELDDDAT